MVLIQLIKECMSYMPKHRPTLTKLIAAIEKALAGPFPLEEDSDESLRKLMDDLLSHPPQTEEEKQTVGKKRMSRTRNRSGPDKDDDETVRNYPRHSLPRRGGD